MSNIDLENGYTRIANEILEVLAITDLNGTQRRILDVLLRQTYGYQRKEHELSLNFISNATNIHKMQIQRELAALIERKIISVVSEATFSKSRVIAFNKDYKSWLNSEQLTKTLTGSEIVNHTVSEKANYTVSELANQIKKKENIKESSKVFNEDSIEYQLSERLFKNIILNDSKAKKPNLSKWAEHIDKLIRLDDRTVEEIETVIDFATTDDFWKSNILSTKKLRDKFTQLYVKQQSKPNMKNSPANKKDDSSSNWRGSDKRLC